MNDAVKTFIEECKTRVASYVTNEELQIAVRQFNTASNKAQYSYNFKWMDRPIIRYPQDMLAMQEIIWNVHLSQFA